MSYAHVMDSPCFLFAACMWRRYFGGDDTTGDGGTPPGGPDARVTPLPDAQPVFRGCSDDLHDILDGNGQVVSSCPLDQGCSVGECLPACEAAANSDGNVGCDFFVTTPHFYTGIAPPCFAAFVTNNWGSPAGITVSRDGQSFSAAAIGRIADGVTSESMWAPVPASGLPENEVAVLFLSQDPSSQNGSTPLTCPVPPAISVAGGTAAGFGNDNPIASTGKAWRIRTDVPVSMYDILPYGGAASFLPSAQLVMPISALGDNFIVSVPKTSGTGVPWLQVMATEDNTTLTIVPSVGFPGGGGVTAAPAGVAATFTLNAGDYHQWQFGINALPSGSVISSDKPVATIGGDSYICYSSLTSSGGGCDSAHQIIPPISAMGMEYVAAPYRSRSTAPESIFYRITGVVDGTTLTYSPAVVGAPITLESGQIVDFESTLAFTATTQDIDHPIHLAQMMSGTNVNTPILVNMGDEEYVNVLPPAQFLRKYVFFTDPSYPNTSLALTRIANEQGEFADVSVGCLGVVGGWTAADGAGKYEVTTVDLVINGTGQASCVNGSQSAESTQPFGVTVWGLATYASYAYPAGGNAATINEVIIEID